MNLNRLKKLDELFEKQVEKGELFGSAIAIGKGRERIFTGEYGDMKADSFNMLCSMTKPITSVAAWILIERGVIDPMEKLGRYLPKFCNAKVYKDGVVSSADREILLRDCLNMTSGITYGLNIDAEEGTPDKDMLNLMFDIKKRIDAGEKMSNVDIVNEFGTIPLVFQPGEQWEYGKSADVIGAVVETAAGIPLGEFFEKEIFQPLDMQETGFVIPKDKIAKRKAKISKENPDGTISEITDEEFYGDTRKIWEKPYMENGGGGASPVMGRGLYSTLNDYEKFCKMLLNKGMYNNYRILSERTVDMFSKSAITKSQSRTLWPWLDGYGYGNFMRVMVKPSRHQCNWSVGEFGWDGALGTYFQVDPKTDTYVVHMQQRVEGDIPQTRRKMLNIIYSAM